MRAATHGAGIIPNRPLTDGNNCTALLTAYLYLALNEIELEVSEQSAVDMVLALAADRIDPDAFAARREEPSRKTRSCRHRPAA